MNKYQTVEILLVEDSEHDAEMTMRVLKRRGIVNEIAWVKDGVEAVEYLFCEGEYADRDNGMPKLVLLDMKMPRMDGLQVLRKLKSAEKTRHIPVIMLTSSQEESDLMNSYLSGVNSYIVKPVDFEQFDETIAQVGMYWAVVNQTPG
ncbi:MAG TPA: response regulator [Arenimonas sp.]|nr:response regulator [Arenimonas sp.]HPO25669.1 response regulator [Arenimonas sp.]HPW32314.1 response regulator [Arenimonas sp.]